MPPSCGAGGITTFAQLAEADEAQLGAIIQAPRGAASTTPNGASRPGWLRLVTKPICKPFRIGCSPGARITWL